MIMKKMMIVALTMMSATLMAQNNDQQRPQMDRATMVKVQTERMASEYGLDEAQTAKLMELNTQFAEKIHMGGMRGQRRGGPNGGPNGGQRRQNVDGQTGASPQQGQMQQGQRPSREQMEARMKEMRANREAYNAELKKIMTEEQFSKYEVAEKQRMERRGPRGPRR